MRTRSVKIDLQAHEAETYSRLRNSDVPVIKDEEILRVGAERLLGIPVSGINYTSSVERQLHEERARLAELEQRLAEKSPELEELSSKLHEYQADIAALESIMPVLEHQVRQLKRALGMKLTPPRFIKEDQ